MSLESKWFIGGVLVLAAAFIFGNHAIPALLGHSHAAALGLGAAYAVVWIGPIVAGWLR